MEQKHKAGTAVTIIAWIIVLVFSLPFIWMALASFKTDLEIISNNFLFKPTTKNYNEVFERYDFIKFIINSLIVAIGATAGSLLLGLPAAYAIARCHMQGLGVLLLVARIIPAISFLIPWFILFSGLGLIDTYLVLILSHMLVCMPFITWVMISFFDALPIEIEESATIDGAGRMRVFLSIVLPVSGAGIITSSLLSVIFSWNNFIFSLIFSGTNTKTLPVAVFNFISYSEVEWGGLMAAACIITLPVLIIALIAQRYIVSGLAAGAVKG